MTETAHHVTGIVACTCVNVTFVLCCLDCTASPAHGVVMDEPQLDVQVEQPPPIAVANAGCDEACNCIDSGVKTHADAPLEATGAATLLAPAPK